MIALGSDHAGFALKNVIAEHLKSRGFEVRDYGTFDCTSCDYPIFAEKVGNAVASGECEKGILVCGTGVGMSIAANKIKGVRAACCTDAFSAKYTRLHNDANILCLGARVLGEGLALMLCDLFIDTPYEGVNGGNHARRVALIRSLEEK